MFLIVWKEKQQQMLVNLYKQHSFQRDTKPVNCCCKSCVNAEGRFWKVKQASTISQWKVAHDFEITLILLQSPDAVVFVLWFKELWSRWKAVLQVEGVVSPLQPHQWPNALGKHLIWTCSFTTPLIKPQVTSSALDRHRREQLQNKKICPLSKEAYHTWTAFHYVSKLNINLISPNVSQILFFQS